MSRISGGMLTVTLTVGLSDLGLDTLANEILNQIRERRKVLSGLFVDRLTPERRRHADRDLYGPVAIAFVFHIHTEYDRNGVMATKIFPSEVAERKALAGNRPRIGNFLLHEFRLVHTNYPMSKSQPSTMEPQPELVRATVCIPFKIHQRAKARAKATQRSFSGHVSALLLADNEALKSVRR